MIKQIDLRDAIIDSLIEIREKSENISLITVDSKTSSKVAMFEEKFGNSFYNLGIAEQHAIDVAAGLASNGETVVVIGIATFLTMRCFEQIRSMIGYNNYNVKIIGLWSGLHYSIQGFTHMAVEDIAIIRSIPNFQIYSPFDYKDVKESVIKSLTTHGPTYIRVESPFIDSSFCSNDYTYNSQSLNNDILIITTGQCMKESLLAAKELKKNNISCSVRKITTLKPIDEISILNVMKSSKAIISVEEHRTIGGLGSIIEEIIIQNAREKILFYKIGVSEKLYHNLNYSEAKIAYGISVNNIVFHAKRLLEL